MNATDELRRMLDERGVEWEDMSARLPTGMLWCTEWTSQDGEPCTAIEGADDIPDGKLSVQALLTPAQAIAATLGTETCHNADIGAEGYFKCSECGASCSVDWERSGWGEPRHCPNCGRKVVGE